MFLHTKEPSIEELTAAKEAERLAAMGVKVAPGEAGNIPGHALTRRGRGLLRR